MTAEVEIYYSILLYSLSALIAVGINGVFLLRARKTDLLRSFFRVQLMIILWLTAKVLRQSAPNLEIAWFWNVVQFLPICYFGASFLDFTYSYATGRKLSGGLLGLVYGISTLNYLALFTNPLHGLFITDYTITQYVMGPLFYIHTATSYIILATAYYYLFKVILSSEYVMDRRQRFFFVLGILLPAITNVLVVTGLLDFAFDLTPITFNITILVFGYSAYRYRFLDIRTVSRDGILENIHEGILVLDRNNSIVKVNSVLRKSVSSYVDTDHITTLDEFFKGMEGSTEALEHKAQTIFRCIREGTVRYSEDITLDIDGNRLVYRLKLEKIVDSSGDGVGYVLRLIDVTRHMELLEGVDEKNQALKHINNELSEDISAAKRLVAARERSRISKEIHDILGHSMTLVISLLEISKSFVKEDVDEARAKLKQSNELIRNGLFELKESMKRNTTNVMNAAVLHEDLNRLIADFKNAGMGVDFFYKPTDSALSAEVVDTVYRVCQEGLTNALKHSNATMVTIGLRYGDGNVDLVIIDDGEGCKEVVKGNGLSGMENRVLDHKGYFSCGSPEGEGFNIHVRMPCML